MTVGIPQEIRVELPLNLTHDITDLLASRMICRSLLIDVLRGELVMRISSDVPACAWCEGPVPHFRRGKIFCSGNCRQNHQRKK
jgi:hypothetical protein